MPGKAVVIINLFSVFAKIGLDSSEFDRGIGEATQSGMGFGGVIGGVAKTVAAAGAAIGAAMVGIGAASMRVGMDMQSSMGAIQAQTGMATDDVRQLDLVFRDMSLSGTHSATEIAAAYAAVAVATHDVETATDIMSAAMLLANATGNDLGQSAYFLANYLLKVGKDSSYAEKYVNLFTIATQNTGIGLTSLQNYIYRMTPAFEQFGASSETNIAVLSRLYQAGIRGASLYSGMGSIMMEVATNFGVTAEWVEKFGIAQYDANGVARDNIDIMTDLALVMREQMGSSLEDMGVNIERLNQLVYEQGEEFDMLTHLMEEYGIQANIAAMIAENMTAVQAAAWFEFMNLADEIRDEVIPSFERYGAAAEAAEIRTAGLGTGFGILRNSLEVMKLALFDVIESPIGSVLEKLGYHFRYLAKRLGEGGDLNHLVVQLGEAIGRLAEHIGEMLIKLIPIVLEWLPKLAEWLIKGIDFVADWGREIAIAIVVIKGLKILKITTPLVKGLGAAFTYAKGKIAAFAGVGGLGKVVPGIKGALGAKGAAGGAGAIGLKGLLAFLGPKGWLVAGIGAVAIGFGAYFKHLMENNEEFSSRVIGIWESIKESGKKIWDEVKETIKVVWEFLEPFVRFKLDKMLTHIEFVLNNIINIVTFALNLIRNTFELVMALLTGDWERAWNAVESILEATVIFINNKIDNVKNYIIGKLNAVRTFLENFDLFQIGVNIIDGLVNGITSVADRVKDAVSNIAGSISGIFRRDLDTNSPSRVMDGIGRNTIQGLIDGIVSQVGNTVNATQDLTNQIINTTSSRAGEFHSIGQNMMNGLLNGINSMAGAVMSAAQSIAQSAISTIQSALQINSPSRIFYDIGRAVCEGFIIGIESMENKIYKTMDDVFGDLDRSVNIGVAGGGMTNIYGFKQRGFSNMPINVNVNIYVDEISSDMDLDYIAREIGRRSGREIRGRGVAIV